MRGIVLVLVLGACTSNPRARAWHRAADYIPLGVGWRGTYEIRTGSIRTRIAVAAKGGDVRDLPDQKDVRFLFLYGTLAGETYDMAKSIYALSDGGPREFYVDAFSWGLFHDPPVPMLPHTFSSGDEWTWEGEFEFKEPQRRTHTHLRVDGPVEFRGRQTMRTRETDDQNELTVTRWFEKGVGLVGIEVEERGGASASLTLISHDAAAK